MGFAGPALVLAGCAGPLAWDKPGATQADFRRDNYACERDARQSGYYGAGLTGAANMQGFFRRCMEAQGYTLIRQDPAAQTQPAAPSAPPLGNNPTDEQCLAHLGVKCPPYLRAKR